MSGFIFPGLIQSQLLISSCEGSHLSLHAARSFIQFFPIVLPNYRMRVHCVLNIVVEPHFNHICCRIRLLNYINFLFEPVRKCPCSCADASEWRKVAFDCASDVSWPFT